MSTDTLINQHRIAQILLVEDNEGDMVLTQRAFSKAKVSNKITLAKTGEQALKILNKEGEYADTDTPDLVLLDLNLPMMSGTDVLDYIKSHEALKHIPVIMLSSSKADQDVRRSYDHHANGYIVKPVSIESFSNAVQQLEQFWFTLVSLPEKAGI